MLNRRKFLSAAGGMSGGMLGLYPSAHAQSLESCRIVVGFVAGGFSDMMARQMADRMQGHYAGAVVVENKPGASGQIANGFVKEAAPDGSVLLLTHSSSLSMYPFTFKMLPYRPVEDFRPVSSVCYTNHAFCVGPAVPQSVRNMKDFLAWTKANPDRANYGAPGVGSMPHLIMTVVNKTVGADLRPVVYKGTAAAITDMLGGQISGASAPVGNFMPLIRAGKARLIAISGDTRSSFVPDVPTYREQGFDMTAREWYGLFLPAAASDAIVHRANKAAEVALADRKLVEFMKQAGADVGSSTPSQLAEMLTRDTLEWKRLTKEVNFTAES